MATSDRRSFLKLLAAMPLLGLIAFDDLKQKAWAAAGKSASDSIYTRLGVRPLINGRGVWTYLSGTLELPEVREAKHQAAMHYVDIFELQTAVGKRLAELSGAESGMITSGAAGAMAAATAACIGGSDPAIVWQLPDITGLKHEVIMFPGRNAFDSAIRLAGGKLVVTPTLQDVDRSINDNTAMIYTTRTGEQLEKLLVIAKNAKVPVLLDQAAGIPPIDGIREYAKMGVDLYTFSGGKGLRGPQCSGLLFGRKDLIDAAVANYSPWEGSVCRPMKVGKEEIMGCLAAVEWWIKADFNKLRKEWSASLDRIKKLVESVPGVRAEISERQDPYRPPQIALSWDEKAWGFTIADCDRRLREGNPRIEVLTLSNNPPLVPAVREQDAKLPARADEMHIVAVTLRPGDELIIGKRLREILGAVRKVARG
ncbi:MAG: aminotransferase class V-fold PLP-dependent enzyme [Acidobacteria bacterium]|nr:aminotransferase class V-fold PLP-dependent enzyme [Acidobacteriota bacterium]